MARNLLGAAVFGALFALLAIALLALPDEPAGLAPAVQQRLGESGVDNPVTAVLLNFRSYDTLLEVAVLMLALVAVWSVAEPAKAPAAGGEPGLVGMTTLLVPAMIIGAGYILWIGAYAPGGAFQAGAILAAALVLMRLAGLPDAQALTWRRPLLAMGLSVFLGAALLPLLSGQSLLQFPAAQAKWFILAIEAAAAVSIALTLAALCAGGPPPREPPA